MTHSVFITGASRGIGLGLATKYAAKGWTVYAGARNLDGSRERWELERDYGKRVKLVHVDVTHDKDVHAAAKALEGHALDVLINNAGVYADAGMPFEKLTADAVHKSFEVNVLGPIRMTQALLPALRHAKRPLVATVTSKMGSIHDNTSGGSYAYRMSKAAVNMFNKSLSVDFPELTAIVLHPGWVQTDMGGRGATTPVDESVQGLMAVISGATKAESGKFFDFHGKEIPW